MENKETIKEEQLQRVSGGYDSGLIQNKKRIMEIATRASGIIFNESNILISFEELGIESNRLFSIIMDVEDAFDIFFSDDQLNSIKCLNDLIEFLTNTK